MRSGVILHLELLQSVQGFDVIDHEWLVRCQAVLADAELRVLPHHGSLQFRNSGAALLAVFATVEDAARATFEMLAHPAFASADGFGQRIHARAGIHCGLLATDGQSFYCAAVNLTVRIAAHAGLDQLVLSAEAREELAGSDAWSCADLGYVHAKGMNSPVRLFGVLPVGDGRVDRSTTGVSHHD